MKQFQICFTHNEAGKLQEVRETLEARSRKSAIKLGRQLAYERGWWFMSVSSEETKTNESQN